MIKQELTLLEKISRKLEYLFSSSVNMFPTSNKGFVILCIGLPIFVTSFLGWFFSTKLGLAILGKLPWLFVLAALAFILTVIVAAYIAINLTLTKRWWTFRVWLIMRWAYFKDRLSYITTDMRVVRDRNAFADKERGILLTMAKPDSMLGEDATKIIYDDDRHVLLIGGTGAGKGTSFIIPNLTQHAGSCVVVDPSAELFLKTAAFRQKKFGSTIKILDPFGVSGETSHGWNPLLEIDFQNDPRAMDKCYTLAESLIEPMGGNSFFTKSAQELLAMLCGYVGLRSLPENMHLPQIHQLISGGELEGLWVAMSHCDGMNGIVKRYAESCLERGPEEFGSVIQTLRTALRFLMSESMRTNLETSSFSMTDLKTKNVSLYLIIPAGAGETYKGWLRLLFNFAFEAMQDTSIAVPEHPMLMMCDEMPLLGRLERIKRAAGEARKFGVKLFLCAQDITQLKEIYGVAWETFVSNAGLCIFFANNDLETQKYISDRLGQEYSMDQNIGQWQKVLRTEQVERKLRRESEKALFLIAGHKPMLLPRATYYDWNMIPDGLEYDTAPSSPDTATDNIRHLPDVAE